MRSCTQKVATVFLLVAASFFQSSLADSAFIEDGFLRVPRIDIDGYGPMELGFRIVFDGDYRLILEQALETSDGVPNSGIWDPETVSFSLDEVELESGERYAVELMQLQSEPQAIFAVASAILINGTQNVPAPELPPEVSASATQLFEQQCSNCHGVQGEGTAIAPALIACASCGSYETLLTEIRDTMPLGQAASCSESCAAQLASYIQAAFNSSNEAVSNQSVGFIEQLGNGETLRKASEQLVSRLPTLEEFQLVAANGSAGLAAAIAGMMEEDAFHDRLQEIFNDYLLTDKYHSRNGSEAAISLLSNDDFPDRRWFDPGKDKRGDAYNLLRVQTNDGVAREPLALISHVVANDLPFTEILTADYMMMTPYSARSYGVTDIAFANPNDPEEFKPGRLPDVPHAGILTSPMFLNRYPTTSTNRNRGRARVVFDLFLDTDILSIEGVRPGSAVDITTPIPTINNPQCSKCHTVLDPVASIFQNWDHKGRYRPARLSKYGWYADMEARGFNGEVMPLAGNVDSSVQWLVARMANDPKFPRAVTRIMVNGLTGKEPLTAPADAQASQSELEAYVAERTVLNEIQQRFVDDNYNLKTLIREIMLSPYWRASAITAADSGAYANVGSSYLLSPEQLDRKIEVLLGFDWRNSLDQYYKDREKYWASRLGRTFHQIYGGIDSDSITTRLRSPNGMMGAMQLRMANELSCYAVPHDFWLPVNERRLFLFVDQSTNPYNESGLLNESAMELIRQNIRFLHEYLLGENLTVDSPEVQFTFELFMNVLNRGRQYILSNSGEWWAIRLPDSCDRTRDFQGNDLKDVNGEDLRLVYDKQFVIRAWMAVVAYLLADYKFLYS